MTKSPTLDEIHNWPATVDIETAARALGISRAYGYELAKRGEFPGRVLKVGTRRRVVTSSLIPLLDGSADAGAKPA